MRRILEDGDEVTGRGTFAKRQETRLAVGTWTETVLQAGTSNRRRQLLEKKSGIHRMHRLEVLSKVLYGCGLTQRTRIGSASNLQRGKKNHKDIVFNPLKTEFLLSNI
jgi:hypothetical protein